MSRKPHHPGSALTAKRPPHAARHRRRRRAVRHARAPGIGPEPAAAYPPLVAPSPWTRRRHIVAGSAGSLLLGAGVSMASAGIRFGLDSRLDSPMAPHVKAEDALPVAIVITLAAGALIPRWIVRRLRASGFKPSQLDRAAGSKGSLIDAESGWMVVATVAVICGVAASMLPVLLSLASHWASWMFVRFVLSDVFLRLFQMLLLTALCSFPFVAMGLTAASLFKLVSKTAASSAHSWVSLLAGLIVGVGFVLALQSRSFLLLPASSLPVLMLAILACDLWGRCAKAGRFDPAVQFAEARDR